MARRLVRHQAALILVVVALALAACSKKCGSSGTTATDLDPLELDLTPPTKTANGSLSFRIGPSSDPPCRRLPEGSSVTLNGVPGAIGSEEAKCNVVDVTWPPADPAEPKLVINDGTSKLEISIPVATPFRLVTPTVHNSHAMATMVIEAAALEGKLEGIDVSYTREGEDSKRSIPSTAVKHSGKRIVTSLAAKELKPGPYRFDVKFKVVATPTVNPPRKTPPKAIVHVSESFKFDVEP